MVSDPVSVAVLFVMHFLNGIRCFQAKWPSGARLNLTTMVASARSLRAFLLPAGYRDWGHLRSVGGCV